MNVASASVHTSQLASGAVVASLEVGAAPDHVEAFVRAWNEKAYEARVEHRVEARSVKRPHGHVNVSIGVKCVGGARVVAVPQPQPQGRMMPVPTERGAFQSVYGGTYSLSLKATDEGTLRAAVKHILRFLDESVPFEF